MRNIDFHAHILPAADHGSENLTVSLQQLTLAKQAGIDTIVATPHFYPQQESLEAFVDRRRQCASRLRDAVKDKALPHVLIGAEVQLVPSLDRLDGLEQLCVEGTNVLLLELSPHYSVRHYGQVIDNLIYSKGFEIVLAHIDRYASVHVDFLLDCGCLAQINTDSLCRLFSSKRSMQWARGNSVVALGSDIHGTETGYRSFLKAKKRLGQTYETVMARTEELLFR